MEITAAFACITCNRQIKEAIWNSKFYPNLLTMLLAFIVLTIIVAILSLVTAKRYHNRIAANPGRKVPDPVPLTTASMVTGIGIGGFIDGIFFHQVFQWHEMLSNKIPTSDVVGKSVNMFWDGIFHFFCLVVVITGIVLLWRLLSRNDIDRSRNLLAAGLITGWGVFNIVEGIINHHLLKLHNIFEFSAHHNIGNYGFLGGSVLLLVIGYIVGKGKGESGKVNSG
jgi:uncharacterized membrane protein